MTDHPLEPAFGAHDHGDCVTTAMTRAETKCQQKSLRLTPVRRRVLEILLEEHKALGAYDILERLAAEGLGSQPPVAYRALQFLEDNGFVHKLRQRSGYIACGLSGDDHQPAFLICRGCDAVAEADLGAALEEIDRAAEALGFAAEYQTIETEGLCPSCQKAGA